MKKTQKKPVLYSISYIHDPDAAQKWFDIYIEMVKQELLKRNQKEMD